MRVMVLNVYGGILWAGRLGFIGGCGWGWVEGWIWYGLGGPDDDSAVYAACCEMLADFENKNGLEFLQVE